ncbi:unnamed protein product [Effrenium voratum]|uniref:Uncharacterized protein n=1 Tax=Effrenium voratum TaxID=2562239 RepID=A0AA36IIB3_9DINO|nr:unnamed protein product [Effrenium voratum]
MKWLALLALSQVLAHSSALPAELEDGGDQEEDADNEEDLDVEEAPVPAASLAQVSASKVSAGLAKQSAAVANSAQAAPPKIPDVLPSGFDAISFLAESENAEEAALTAEADAVQAQAQEARSGAWLRRNLARLRNHSAEDADLALAVKAARQSLAQKAPFAAKTWAKARRARQAALQATKAVPFLGQSGSLRSFGPERCVTTWRGSSGSCFLRSDCDGVPDFDFFDIGFLCEGSDKVEEHRFGAGVWGRREVQDTAVQCGRCLPLEKATAAALSKEVRSLKSSLSTVTERFSALQAEANRLRR